jgi:murein tripeptide amidase MpaA
MAEASEDLRRRFLEEIVLHAVPIVAMDAWYEGLDYHLSGTNLNRDWQKRSQPETRALVANLDKLSAEGEQPVLALDLHNGWHSREHDGSAMTVWPVDAVGPETVQRQHRLIERIAEHCDYIPADAVWSNGFSPDRFAAQMWKRYGAQAHTMEFSRFSIWERQQGRVPLTQQRIEHLGRDLAKAILEWLSEEGSG